MPGAPAAPEQLAPPSVADTQNDTAVEGPRRSTLAQERSRRTRKELVNAAIQLWTERGFENGIETTTVAEIARHAGVTKGTFYFHFAHKEDVLLDMAWATGDAMVDEANRLLDAGRSLDDTLEQIMTSMARRTERMPRAAIARTLHEFYKNPMHTGAHERFRRAFALVFAHARKHGDLPAHVDVENVTDMMNALVVGAVEGWVAGATVDLTDELVHRSQVLLAGVRAMTT